MKNLGMLFRRLLATRSSAARKASLLIWWRYWRHGRPANDCEFADIVAECWKIPPGEAISIATGQGEIKP